MEMAINKIDFTKKRAIEESCKEFMYQNISQMQYYSYIKGMNR